MGVVFLGGLGPLTIYIFLLSYVPFNLACMILSSKAHYKKITENIIIMRIRTAISINVPKNALTRFHYLHYVAELLAVNARSTRDSRIRRPNTSNCLPRNTPSRRLFTHRLLDWLHGCSVSLPPTAYRPCDGNWFLHVLPRWEPWVEPVISLLDL